MNLPPLPNKSTMYSIGLYTNCAMSRQPMAAMVMYEGDGGLAGIVEDTLARCVTQSWSVGFVRAICERERVCLLFS